jgi:UDP-sugar transporter A1/2/3
MYTWLALLSQAAMGVSLSFIFQFLDSIVYTMCLTVSMFVTSILSAMFFDFHIDLNFICATGIVTLAIYLYYRRKMVDEWRLNEANMKF